MQYLESGRKVAALAVVSDVTEGRQYCEGFLFLFFGNSIAVANFIGMKRHFVSGHILKLLSELQL